MAHHRHQHLGGQAQVLFVEGAENRAGPLRDIRERLEQRRVRFDPQALAHQQRVDLRADLDAPHGARNDHAVLVKLLVEVLDGHRHLRRAELPMPRADRARAHAGDLERNYLGPRQRHQPTDRPDEPWPALRAPVPSSSATGSSGSDPGSASARMSRDGRPAVFLRYARYSPRGVSCRSRAATSTPILRAKPSAAPVGWPSLKAAETGGPETSSSASACRSASSAARSTRRRGVASVRMAPAASRCAARRSPNSDDRLASAGSIIQSGISSVPISSRKGTLIGPPPPGLRPEFADRPSMPPRPAPACAPCAITATRSVTLIAPRESSRLNRCEHFSTCS